MHINLSFISSDGWTRAQALEVLQKKRCFFRPGLTPPGRSGPESKGTYFFGLAILRFVGDEIFLHRPGSSIPVKIQGAVGDVTNPELAGRR